MEKKILAYAFCLLILVACIIFWVSRESVEEVQAHLDHAQAQLETVQTEFQENQAQLTARKEAAALITEASGLNQQNRQLREEIQAIHRQRLGLVTPPPRQRPEGRQEAGGQVIPEIILATGTTLKQVTVQSMNAETTVLRHSEGVSSVPTSILPATLVDKHLGPKEPAASGTGAPAKAPSGTAPTTPAEAAPAR